MTGASKAAESWSRAASTSCGVIDPKRIQNSHPSSSVSALDDLPVYSTPASLPYSAELVRHIKRPPVNQYDIVIDVTHFLSSSSSSSMKTTTAAASSHQMRTTPHAAQSSPPPSLSSNAINVPEAFPQRPCTCPESILGSDEQRLASPDIHKQCSHTVDNDSPFPGVGQLEYPEDREMDDWSGTNPSSSPITTSTRPSDPLIHTIPRYCHDHATLDDRKQS